MVRLKVDSEDLIAIADKLFQFHNGSIKRTLNRLRFSLTLKFQFHNGSIKSPRRFVLKWMKWRFNSTMVRLKVIPNTLYIPAFAAFQFHNGSIKRDNWLTLQTYHHQFQFHNGSIKSYETIGNVVRIETFQFHNGSIKSGMMLTQTHPTQVSIPQWFD